MVPLLQERGYTEPGGFSVTDRPFFFWSRFAAFSSPLLRVFPSCHVGLFSACWRAPFSIIEARPQDFQSPQFSPLPLLRPLPENFSFLMILFPSSGPSPPSPILEQSYSDVEDFIVPEQNLSCNLLVRDFPFSLPRNSVPSVQSCRAFHRDDLDISSP